jgi:methylmalonyl-CoA/ethylmalonyl-CoA epimerase
MNIENWVALAYSDGICIELIEVVSGKSIFMDYINHNSAGGMQHSAYSTPIANLDKVISDIENIEYRMISTFETPIAKIVFCDTQNEINGYSY